MTPARVFTALALAAAAAGIIAFGIVRGVTNAGPPRGVRIAIAIDPPADDAQLSMAEQMIHDRLDEIGEARVVRISDGLVAELGTDDPDGQLVHDFVALLERTAPLEVHTFEPDRKWLAEVAQAAAQDPAAAAAGIRVSDGTLLAADHGDQVLAKYLAAQVPPAGQILAYGHDGKTWRAYLLDAKVLLEGRAIHDAHLADHGVDLELAEPKIVAAPGTALAFLLGGKVDAVATVHASSPGQLQLRTSGRDADAAVVAMNLLSVVRAGAVHPLHVIRREPFTRATGFVPRAWPFLAIGAVLLIAAVLVLLRRRRVH